MVSVYTRKELGKELGDKGSTGYKHLDIAEKLENSLHPAANAIANVTILRNQSPIVCYNFAAAECCNIVSLGGNDGWNSLRISMSINTSFSQFACCKLQLVTIHIVATTKYDMNRTLTPRP